MKTTISIAETTTSEVDRRDMQLGRSHVIDRDLHRFYALMAEEQKTIKSIITAAEQKRLAKALKPMSLVIRLAPITLLRSVLETSALTEFEGKHIAHTIKQMPTSQFLALVDLLESINS